MHGCGNDYIVINCFEESVVTPSKLARKISDRHFGVGSDGLILIMPSRKVDFRMRMFNPDGSEAEICGNGIRCLGKYVYDHRLTNKKNILVETRCGIKGLKLFIKRNYVYEVEVDMGKLQPISKSIFTKADGKSCLVKDKIRINDKIFDINVISMGNPHCVIFVDNVDNFSVDKFGPIIENHRYFPQRANIEFVEILNAKGLKQRTWERGCGETLACGSGACVGMAAAFLNRKINNPIEIYLRGGKLFLKYESNGHIYMRGGVSEVFNGEYNLSYKV